MIWTILLLALAGVSVAMWLVALARPGAVRLSRGLIESFMKQATLGRVLAVVFFVVACIIAGAKPGGGAAKTLSDEDFRRGFVMARIGHGESFDFSPPSNAVVCADWLAFGAAEDWTYLEMGGQPFPFGTAGAERLCAFSFGEVRPCVPGASGRPNPDLWLAPLLASAGITPEANWCMLPGGGAPSRFWHCHTPCGSLLLTWQNVLLGRNPDSPVSFQAELFPDGRFCYRYDFSGLGARTVPAVAGASLVGIGWTSGSLQTNVTSISFCPLSAEDASDPDADGDGISTRDEIFVHGTDPHDPDTDHDGLSDFDELFVYFTDPLEPNSAGGPLPDGFTVKLGGLDPFSCPEGSTNTVLEHVFYSGAADGAFLLPKPSVGTVVLKVSASGRGSGRLVIGDSVIPLIAPPPLRGGAATNTLLLAVGKGLRKVLWMDKPDGLDVGISSDDLLVGRLPSALRPRGWIAFPYTDATVPCIHDFASCTRVVSLQHADEFPGLTAEWTCDDQSVSIENRPPASAEIRGGFRSDQTKYISYTVDHPDRLNRNPVTIMQELRFCPRFVEDDAPVVPGGGGGGEHEQGEDDCQCPSGGGCLCCRDGLCGCLSPNCPCGMSGVLAFDDGDDEEAERAYTNIVGGAATTTEMSDVLRLYGDDRRTVHLQVPSGEPRQCCECPEHCQSNYVAGVCSSHCVTVKDSSGGDFDISYESCDVTVIGVSPSRGFADSTVVFVTNGVERYRHNFTVLGVRFESEAGCASLDEYNRLSRSLGYPVPVSTNAEYAGSIAVRTDVHLPDGVVRLSLKNVKGDVSLCLAGWTDDSGIRHGAEPILRSGTAAARHFTLREWRGLMRRYGGSEKLSLKVLSSAESSCDVSLEFVAANGLAYVRDSAEQRVSTVMPMLLPDYNRDGKIDAADADLYVAGRVFRHWVNECKVSGAVWEEPSLFEGVADAIIGLENWRNKKVDGAYDLMNLFPVAVNFGPFMRSWGEDVSFKITSESGPDAFNYTLADIDHLEAGTVRTAPHVDVDGKALESAELVSLGNDGIVFSGERALSFGTDSCLLVAESRASCEGGMRMTVSAGGRDMYSCKLPITTSSVDEMFRFVSLRDAFKREMTSFEGTEEPPNNPDSELGDKDVFFVHGFNVDLDGAKNWNREMFKRLWVSGMNARYWGVTWSGDSGLVNGLHYHRDVRQALMTAPSFRNLVNAKGVDSVVIGHSLGNMVVSEALLKGMDAKTYVMLDAAVASEAYRPELQADSDETISKYRPGDWAEYDSLSWAANWHTWFTNNTDDARGKIGWAGHFAPLLKRPGLDVYNFYSSGDEVFAENSETPGIATGVFHWPTLNLDWPLLHFSLELDAFPWQKQEVFKGVNAAGSLSAGWGFHCWATNVNNETVWVRYSAEDANAMVSDGSISTNAVFDRGVSAMFNSVISDYDIADILAFHIPAVSSAAGKVTIRESDLGMDINLNASDKRANGWGREGVLVVDGNGQQNIETPWLHSDIKNMAYYYVYPAFTNMVENGGMR